MLPFEESLPFEASLPFEQEEEQPRTLVQAQQQFKQMGPLEQAWDVVKGTGEAALSMATVPAGYLAGGAAGISALAQGLPFEQAADVVGRTAEEFTYKPRTAGGQILTEEYLGPGFEKAKDVAGRIGELSPGAALSKQVRGMAGLPPDEAGARTGAEAVFEGALFAGAPVAGLRTGRVRQARQAEMSKAQDILNKAQETEAKLAQEQAAQKAYQEGYEQLDSTMMRYPKDYQAPQYGMGGKVARPPDAVKAERPVADQLKFDEDVRQIAEREAMRAVEQEKMDQFIQNRPMPQPMEPRKSHVVGPQATSREIYSDPLAAADAVRAKMREAAVETQRVVPDQEIKPLGAQWANQEAKWRSIDIYPERDILRKESIDIRKVKGGYLVTGPRRFGDPWNEYQTHLRHEFTNLAGAKLYAEDYAAYLRGERTRPDSFNDKYIYATPKDKALKEWIDNQPKGGEGRSTPGFNARLHELQTGLRWNNERSYFEEIATSSRSQLEAIRDSSEVPYYKELAKLLLADKEFNPKFEIQPIERIQQATGRASEAAYDPRKHSILVPIKATGKEALTLHEFIHAATYGAIEGVRSDRAIAMHLTKPVERLQGLYNSFHDFWTSNLNPAELQLLRASGTFEGRPYGLTNIHEFIAEGFTNPNFQALLARTKLPASLQYGRLRTYWDKFVDTIGKLLGFDRNKHNYLSELIRVGADIIQGAGSDVRRLYDKSPEGHMPGGFELKDFKQQLKDQGVRIPDEAVKALWDARQKPIPDPKAHPSEKAATSGAVQFQRQYADRRTLEEVAATLKDVKQDTLADQASLNTIGKIIQGRFIAADNPLLSWVSSQIHWGKQEAIQKANNWLHGANRKNPDPGTYNYLWKNFKKEEKIAVNEVGQALQGEQAWVGEAGIQAKARELLGRDLTRNELQAYQDRVRINKQVLNDFNKAMISEGKEPIAELPHYWSPAVFDGPFKVRFLDKDGNTVKMTGSYIRPNEAKLQKQFPEYKIEILDDHGLRGEIDFQQFEMILRQVSKEMRDPAAKAISEGLRRMGFRKHGLKRKGVQGAKGTEGGIEGVRNYEETSERYIRQAYDFLANRQLDKTIAQVRDLKEANHLPYTKTWALEALDQARGGSNKFFDEFSRTASAAVSGTIAIASAGKLRLPQRFLRDFIRQGNKVKTTMLLGFFNFIHMGAQLIQAPTFMPPKLLSMAVTAGVNPARIMNVMARGLAEYSKWDSSKDAANLSKIGAFDATFKYDWSTYAGDSSPHYKRSLVDHATGLSTLMWEESHAVRRPAAHMFLEMLREIGYNKIAKDKMEIYKVAREMTDHYMVSMRFYEKPHIFSRTGLVGMAVSPLKSFATTWLGMLREYSRLSASGLLEGSVAKSLPLGAFLSTSLLTAGMLGFVGVKEWDALAKLANDTFGTNVPTGTEYIMSKFKSPALRYGALSEALPFDLSVGPTFASPSLADQQFWGAPGLDFWAAAAKGLATITKMTGVMGESRIPGPTEKREAAKGVTPRFSPIPGYNWGDIEKYYTPEGQPYAEAGGQSGPYTRTEKDWTARRLGTYTTQERDEKNKFYTAQKRVVSMTKHVDRAVDIILSGKGMDRLPTLWQELAQKGFTSQEITTALRREVINRLVEADIRATRSMTPKQQRLWMLYQQLDGQKGEQGAPLPSR